MSLRSAIIATSGTLAVVAAAATILGAVGVFGSFVLAHTIIDDPLLPPLRLDVVMHWSLIAFAVGLPAIIPTFGIFVLAGGFANSGRPARKHDYPPGLDREVLLGSSSRDAMQP